MWHHAKKGLRRGNSSSKLRRRRESVDRYLGLRPATGDRGGLDMDGNLALRERAPIGFEGYVAVRIDLGVNGGSSHPSERQYAFQVVRRS